MKIASLLEFSLSMTAWHPSKNLLRRRQIKIRRGKKGKLQGTKEDFWKVIFKI